MTTKQAQISNWRNELTPNIVDHLARVTPDAPYALYPKSPVTYDEGYRTVTYKAFANAINGFAWWLTEHLGSSTDFEAIAYIGPNDVRYTALLLGAIKAGYVAFFTSPRNSVAAHGALFNKLKCRTMLTPGPTPPAVGPILNAHPMKHLHVPSAEDLLDKIYPHYPYNKTFESARGEPWVIIHTSGSTGIPKPLIWTHEAVARHSRYIAMDPPAGFQALDRLSQGKRILNMFPPFHAACIAVHLINSVPFGSVSIAPLSGAIATAEGVVKALKQAPAEVAFLVPSIAADLAASPTLLNYCAKNLELILYAGGDLPQAVGNKIAAKVPIRCQYGASEIGLTCQLLAPEMTAADWRYVLYHPDLGLAFEEFTPGMFELTVKRDPKYEKHQLPFAIGPDLQDLQVYRSRDLFEKHPTVPNCWGWRARADDIIVFLNGEKTNPVSMEQHIQASNKEVSAALVVGMQRFQAALLVEPAATLGKLTPDEEATFIEKIWPSIEEANKVTPAHARVEKALVFLTALEKPMVRSGKGTIQRQSTVAQYKDEIDDLYRSVDIELSDADEASVNSKDPKQVSQYIRQAISKINPELLQEGTDNFFALGMDSLMALRLVRALRHGIGQPDLSVSVVHNNPSVQLLAQYFENGQTANGAEDARFQSEIGTLLEEYKQAMNKIPSEKSSNGEVVVLTGSTGSLGTHILEALLVNPNITNVYCLNRRKNAQAIHEAKAKATQFPLSKFRDRVIFVHADLHQPKLGLDEATYEALRARTTLIIHNAWPVNFIMPLKAFSAHFDGLMNLFTLASGRPNPPKLHYISSVSSVAQHSPSGPIPEKVLLEFDAAYPMGYAKSKLLSELLCDAAARRLRIPVSYSRVGQIAGPVNAKAAGVWNPAEWLPSLILTSISPGALPVDLGPELNKVDWMPVDVLAKVIVELATHGESGNLGAGVFNVLGPAATSWEKVLPAIISSIHRHAKCRVEAIPLRSWLKKLRSAAEGFSTENTDVIRTHPAIKLQEFYEDRMLNSKGPVEWDMGRAMAISKTLKEMPSVNEGWIDTWVKGWVLEVTPQE